MTTSEIQALMRRLDKQDEILGEIHTEVVNLKVWRGQVMAIVGFVVMLVTVVAVPVILAVL